MIDDALLDRASEVLASQEGASPTGGTSRAWPVGLSIAGVDILAVVLAVVLGNILRSWGGHPLTPRTSGMYIPSGALVLSGFGIFGLYPGIAVNAVVELNLIVKATTVSFLILIATAFFRHESLAYSRGVMALAWGMSILLVFAGRQWARKFFSRFSWWGVRSIMIDTGGRDGVAGLTATERRYGLRIMTTMSASDLRQLTRSDAGRIRKGRKDCFGYAILLLSGVRGEEGAAILDLCSQQFRHTLIVADMPGLQNFGARVREFRGALCVELPHKLLSPFAHGIKRVIDFVASGFLLLVLSPLMILASLAILLTSKGPVCYSHERIGHRGRSFRVRKFRTMVENADEMLDAYLESHPDLKEEWLRDHKLRDDPRSTAIGKCLRKLSLDELPQLWNIFVGEMSLVGPRPITSIEVARYGKQFDLYKTVVPGLTGLWQVSGRNNTTYQQRVAYDEFYVKNWSIWMDLHILIMTARTVLTGDGAY